MSRPKGGRRPLSRVQLLFAVLAMLGLVRIAVWVGGAGGLAIFLGSLALLGIAAQLWGYDSREKGDWKPGAPRSR